MENKHNFDQCPNCGVGVSKEDSICWRCQKNLESLYKYVNVTNTNIKKEENKDESGFCCPECDADVSGEDTVCPNCGIAFQEEETETAETLNEPIETCLKCNTPLAPDTLICPVCNTNTNEDTEDSEHSIEQIYYCPDCYSRLVTEDSVCPTCSAKASLKQYDIIKKTDNSFYSLIKNVFIKPFILSTSITVLSLVVAFIFVIIFALFNMPNAGSSVKGPASWFVAYYIGFIYSGLFKIELNKSEKNITIAYYFIEQMLFYICAVLLVTSNTPFIYSLLVGFVLNLLNSVFVYFCLSRGCKEKIKELSHKELLNNKEIKLHNFNRCPNCGANALYNQSNCKYCNEDLESLFQNQDNSSNKNSMKKVMHVILTILAILLIAFFLIPVVFTFIK
jgi:predicted amidophosphoribosyltransferase